MTNCRIARLDVSKAMGARSGPPLHKNGRAIYTSFNGTELPNGPIEKWP